jgi:hypothetical protein
MTDASEYGGAAPERSSLGIVALAIFKASSGDVQVEPNAYLAESVESFSFNVEGKDGVWEVHFWGLPLYEGQVLAEGDVVLDIDDARTIKKYVDGALTEVSLASLLEDEDVLHSGSKMALVTTDLSIKRDEIELAFLEVAEQYRTSVCDFQAYHEAQKNLNYIRVLRSAAFIHFCRGNYVTAQKHIESGNEFGTAVLEEAE